jgi:hypothetical protein
MGLHVIPRHLQKWMEEFQDSRLLCGSLDIDSLNLSNAKWSVWFSNIAATATILFGSKYIKFKVNRKSRWRYKSVDDNKEKVSIWFRRKKELCLCYWFLFVLDSFVGIERGNMYIHIRPNKRESDSNEKSIDKKKTMFMQFSFVCVG